MLDKDLASLYGVSTGHLNQAVSRNLSRFPEDFMFQLSDQEFKNLMFHFGTSSGGGMRRPKVTANLISQNVTSNWGGTRKKPRAFTEHGILSLSSVLQSQRAIQVNIAIMRAFVQLRQMIAHHKEFAIKLTELEQRIEKHDHEICEIFAYLRKILSTEEKPKRQIGFHP